MQKHYIKPIHGTDSNFLDTIVSVIVEVLNKMKLLDQDCMKIKLAGRL